jgi:hypothetical protein
MPSERRHCRRYPVQAAAYAWLGDDYKAIIQNVGSGGVRIRGSSAINPDCELEIRIVLDTNTGVLETKGRVVWVSESGEAGIQLPLEEWQDYLRYWHSHAEDPAAAIEQLDTPAISAMLPSDPEQLQAVAEADNESALRQLRECWLRSLEADLEAERVWAVRRKYLAAIALTGLICAGSLWALRDRWLHFERASTRPNTSTVSETPQPTVLAADTAPAAPSPKPSPAAASLAVGTSRMRLLEVLPGISYESGSNFARFFIELGEQQKLHPVALKNPDRIYFDIPKSVVRVSHKSVEMRNDFVQRMRVSERGDGLTRVVLDLKCSCSYRVQPASGRPHWLQIEVKPRSTETARLHAKPLSWIEA